MAFATPTSLTKNEHHIAPPRLTRVDSARMATALQLRRQSSADIKSSISRSVGRVQPSLPKHLQGASEAERAAAAARWSDGYARVMGGDEMQFAAVEHLVENGHKYAEEQSSGSAMEPTAMRRLMKEISRKLARDLDLAATASMFLRVDEERPQFLRALLTGVDGSPYESGMFQFDIYVPKDYPQTNPLVNHTTPGATEVYSPDGYSPGGFSPNLHQDSGQVCLSLLGTWEEGVGWDPTHSNLYQVLSSIQVMILAAQHPYYMEPGEGGWEGEAPADDGEHSDEVIEYDEIVKLATAQHAILGMLKSPPRSFEEVVRTHFLYKREAILETLSTWHSSFLDEERKRQLGTVRGEIAAEFKKLVASASGEEKAEESERRGDEEKESVDVAFLRARVAEAEEEVVFVRARADFIARRIRIAEEGTHGDVERAKRLLPKAYARRRMAPRLLSASMKRLAKAQKMLSDAEEAAVAVASASALAAEDMSAEQQAATHCPADYTEDQLIALGLSASRPSSK